MTRWVRFGLDRFLMTLAWIVLRAFFRRVEVEGRERVPDGTPVLVVANHFYGFVDPVMLVSVFGRIPRFLAKSTFWRRPALRPFLWMAGMIPLHRPEDRSDGTATTRSSSSRSSSSRSSNSRAFAACYAALSQGSLVGIFPEGTTHDDPSIRGVRTGAARIALGARAAGVEGLVVVPTGLTFDDKIGLRSGVLGRVGEPIDIDAFATEVGEGDVIDETDRDAVTSLTALIAARLREVAPDYQDAREAAVLRRAAETTLQARGGARPRISVAERETLARRLADAPAHARRDVADRLAHYHLDLEIAGLRDHQVARHIRTRQLLGRSLLATVRLVALAPFALIGVAWNLLPYWLVKAVGRAVARPVTKGTARVSTALIAFPTAWSVVILTDPFGGFLAGLAVLLLAPLFGLIAVGWWEAVVLAHRDWRGWIALTERRSLLATVRASRSAVVTAVERALG